MDAYLLFAILPELLKDLLEIKDLKEILDPLVLLVLLESLGYLYPLDHKDIQVLQELHLLDH
jgi:hypothetical protein